MFEQIIAAGFGVGVTMALTFSFVGFVLGAGVNLFEELVK